MTGQEKRSAGPACGIRRARVWHLAITRPVVAVGVGATIAAAAVHAASK